MQYNLIIFLLFSSLSKFFKIFIFSFYVKVSCFILLDMLKFLKLQEKSEKSGDIFLQIRYNAVSAKNSIFADVNNTRELFT